MIAEQIVKMTDEALEQWLCGKLGIEWNLLTHYTRDKSAAMGLLDGRWVLSCNSVGAISCESLGQHGQHISIATNRNPARAISEAVAQALESGGGK